MMYHLSSHLQGIQIVCPETKPNLSYKEKWVRLLQEDISLFCELYASCDIAQVIQNQLGWRKSKLFCECIFEMCRKNIDAENLNPRMRSIYLSASILEIKSFKEHSGRTGTIFEVNVDINQCQKYDMNLFTKAEIYLSNQPSLTENVFNYCYQIAREYWTGSLSDSPVMEYLYYGKAEIRPLTAI